VCGQQIRSVLVLVGVVRDLEGTGRGDTFSQGEQRHLSIQGDDFDLHIVDVDLNLSDYVGHHTTVGAIHDRSLGDLERGVGTLSETTMELSGGDHRTSPTRVGQIGDNQIATRQRGDTTVDEIRDLGDSTESTIHLSQLDGDRVGTDTRHSEGTGDTGSIVIIIIVIPTTTSRGGEGKTHVVPQGTRIGQTDHDPSLFREHCEGGDLVRDIFLLDQCILALEVVGHPKDRTQRREDIGHEGPVETIQLGDVDGVPIEEDLDVCGEVRRST